MQFSDVVAYAQYVAGFYNYKYPYAFSADPATTSAAFFYPSTFAAYLSLAALEYLNSLQLLTFPTGSILVTSSFFDHSWYVPRAFAVYLTYIGQAMGPPVARGQMQMPIDDYAMTTSGIYYGNDPNNMNSLQIPVGAGFAWFNASTISPPSTIGNGYFNTLLNENNVQGFPYTSLFNGEHPYFGDPSITGPAATAQRMKSVEVIPTVPFNCIPKQAPDMSAFCFPVGASPQQNWWNADCCACPGQIFNPWITLVTAGISRVFNTGIFPTNFVTCLPNPSWMSYSPNQDNQNFVCVNNTIVEQAYHTFTYLCDRCDSFYINGNAIRFERFVTLSGVHVPLDWCKIQLRYIDFYGIIQKMMYGFIKFWSQNVTGVAMNSDMIAGFYQYAQELIRARVHRHFQIDFGNGAGCIGNWGFMNNTVGPGVLNDTIPTFLKWILDEIGWVRLNGFFFIPMIDENYAAATYNNTTGVITNLVQFPTIASNPAIFVNYPFNGAPQLPSGNLFTWFPFTNFDALLNPTIVTGGTGINLISGAGTKEAITENTAVAETATSTISAGSFLNLNATVATNYLGLPAIPGTAFKCQINAMLDTVTGLREYFANIFNTDSIGQRAQTGLPNNTNWGGPGIVANVIATQLTATALYTQARYITMSSLAVPIVASALQDASLHVVFSNNRVESALVLTPKELGHTMAAAICVIYRSSISDTFAIVAPSSVQFATIQYNAQFKTVIQELLNTSSEVNTIYQSEQEKHSADSSQAGDSMYVSAKMAANVDKQADCLRKAINNVASRIGNELIKPETIGRSKMVCHASLKVAKFVGLPFIPEDFACMAVENAVKAAQGFVNHYTQKKKGSVADS